MKILLVITHGNVGGATNFVLELARDLKTRGEKVTVAFGHGAYLEEQLRKAAVPVHHFHNLKRTHNPFSLFLFINEIRRFTAKERFDVVQFNSSNTLPGALGVKFAARSMRTVFTVHGLSMLSRNYKAAFYIKWIYRLFFQFFLSFIDAPVFVSQHDLSEARRLGLAPNGSVVHNGINPSGLHFLARKDAREELSRKTGRNLDQAFIVGSIGRLSYEKNYEFVIDAFPEIIQHQQNALFVVIGEGPKRADYEATASMRGLSEKVLLPGEILDGSEYLRAFDVFVLASRYEGLPMTLIESLFAEIPVIAPAIGGIPEILSPRSLYPFGDKKDFLEKFRQMIADPASFIPSIEKQKQFTGNAMIEEYLKIFSR